MNESAADLQEREARCRLALDADPGSASAHLALGNVLLAMERTGEAERELRRAVELQEDLVEALVNLGGVLFRRWEFRGAVEANRRAAAVRPDLLIAHHNQGLGHLYLGEAGEMVACFSRALELDGNHAGSRYHLAVGLLALGRVEESRRHLDVARAGGYSPAPDFLKALEKAEASRGDAVPAPGEQTGESPGPRTP